MAIKVRSNGLEIDGNLLPLISGSVQYWRLDPEAWSKALDSVKELGFGVIETYVPWAVHEIEKGEFDFGKQDPAKNLDAFLSLAEEKGLKVLVRPGPHINAELNYFGYPERIVKDQDFWALDANGSPAVLTPLPCQMVALSHAQARLFEEFEVYLAAVCPILLKHLHPRGGIVALQVDNETSYFFRHGTYDLDYSQASIKLFQHFLELKYRTLKALNAAYHSQHKSFEEVPAPKRNLAKSAEELAPFVDWAEYKEYAIQWSLSKLAELYRSKGFEGVPFFHNSFWPVNSPINIPDLEKDAGIDFCGFDAYPLADQAGPLAEHSRYLGASSRLPMIPEFGAGSWLDRVPIAQQDLEANLLVPLMGGVKALNFYMLVERERWVGSPISRHGLIRPVLGELFQKLNRFYKQQEWQDSSFQYQAGLVASREWQVLEASFQRPGFQLAHFALPEQGSWEAASLKGFFGEDDPGLPAVRKFHLDAKQFLRESQIPYVLADSALPTEKLKRLSFVLVTSWASLEEAFAKRLLNYVEDGGLLVLGPLVPKLTPRGEKLQAFGELDLASGKPVAHGEGKILALRHSFDTKAVNSLLAKARIRPEVSVSDPSLDTSLHKLSGRQVLFIRNPVEEAKTCTVFRDGKFVLKPLWSSGKFLGAVEEREVNLGPREIKVWEIIPC